MTPDDLRIHATALGFIAVILGDVPCDKQTQRAIAIARLIESYCHETVPEAFHGCDAFINSTLSNSYESISMEKPV
jgi:hypothetical protein